MANEESLVLVLWFSGDIGCMNSFIEVFYFCFLENKDKLVLIDSIYVIINDLDGS